ncbi:hypothetical protein [Neobacillus niacini]|nr:hypothetical protein [Neobacillus niacini]MDR6998858.1 hypothetical protein [Neobacillus niacini]
MKKEQDNTSEGLNQIFEVINAKGDTGELKEIIGDNESKPSEEQDQE